MTDMELSTNNTYMQYITVAERIAKTAMVPPSLRGKPDEVLAVMLYGQEVGIGPMQSLQQINFIAGKPSLAAELMRALVLKAGHQFILDTNNAVANAKVKRRDWEEWREVTFTIDDAHRANLSGDGWKKYPDQMLGARVTSKACRMFFADVIAGMSYTPDEIMEFSEPVTADKGTKPKTPEVTQRSAPVVHPEVIEAEVVSTRVLATDETCQQIKDGLEMMNPDDRKQFADWWESSGITRGVDNLDVNEARTVYARLMGILNTPSQVDEDEGYRPVEAQSAPNAVIAEHFGEVEEVATGGTKPEPSLEATVKQVGYIRKLASERNLEPHEAVSGILGRQVSSLKELTKAEAKKVIDQLLAL